MSDYLYKVLNKDGSAANGGSGKWHLPKGTRPGKWMPKIKDIEPCERGYHLCRKQDLTLWLGPTIWIAEGRGKHIEDGNKIVFVQARLIRKLDTWNKKTARLFAADCAEHVLHIFEKYHPNDPRPRQAIQAARDYANGLADAAMAAAADAAWAAARAAASAAAWAAARAAAWDAASAAARAAKWDAASAAASAAAMAAAADAAWAAADAAWAAADAAWAAASAAASATASATEVEWQTNLLFKYLEQS